MSDPTGSSTAVLDADPDAPPAPPLPPVKARRRDRWFRYTLPGAWGALIFACLSFTPSLLPRSGLIQGAVVGIDAAIGYGLGVLAAWVWRAFADRDVRPTKRRSWQVFGVVAAISLVTFYVLGRMWQDDIRELMGSEGEGAGSQILLPVIAALLFTGLVALSRQLRRLYHWVARRLQRWIGPRAAAVVGWVAVVGLTVWLVSGVLLQNLSDLANEAFSVRNGITAEGVVQPTSALRSGSSSSLVPWDTLGRQGRTFVAQGPTAQDISTFNGTPALEPIRTYAGLESGDTTEERAALAVRDLERAGGFDRKYLLVITTTGSGWVSPGAIDSFEYMTGGDEASIAIQYSYLPSWISYLVDQTKAREAGRTLFDAVYEQWSQLPQETRPQLVIFGESLGSFGGESAFSGEYDLSNRTDGALFTGPPNFNTLYREFTDDRDPGTPEAAPTYRDGRIVRFRSMMDDPIEPTAAPWSGTRVLYALHPSDPIVWWSPRLLLNKPDWLSEPRGGDVLGATRWMPFVTFWQVTADLPMATNVPPGHGHNYDGDYVSAWATVLQPPGWSTAKAEQLQQIVLGIEH